MTTTQTVAEIIAAHDWTEPREVQTKRGPRMVSDTRITPELERYIASHRNECFAAGLSVSEFRGIRKVTHWQEVGAAVVEKRQQAVMESRAASVDIELPCPDGLAYLPYQRAGIAYAMSRKAVLIGDEMGLGKTIQAIGVINATPEAKKIIVVCPASLKLNWEREMRKWLVNQSLTIGHASTKDGRPATNIVIVNYDILTKFPDLADRIFDVAILDEAHYCKNGKAKRTVAAIGSRKEDKTGIRAHRRILLTGTPLTNRPIELYSLLSYLQPDRWPSVFSFGKRYCAGYQGRHGWDFTGQSNLEELQRVMRETVMVRRLKADVLTELPPKRRQIVMLARNGAAKAIEAEIRAADAQADARHRLMAQVELSKASADPADYASAVAAMQEAARGAFTELAKLRHETALAKVPYVVEHATSAAEQAQIVIFAHHKDVLTQIAEGLTTEGHTCVIVTGDMELAARQRSVDAFQAGEAQVILGTIGAMGVGHTLTRSAHVIFAELDWVPANVSQAEDRTHRIGQTGNVLIQHLIFDGSIDSRMAEILVEKQEIIDRALDRVAAPEEQAPLIPVAKKEQASTRTTKQEEIAKMAETMTPEKIALVHRGLQMLAGMCDGAEQLDGAGFSKIDVMIGHDLAAKPALSPRQAALGSILCRKYRRQIPAIAEALK